MFDANTSSRKRHFLWKLKSWRIILGDIWVKSEKCFYRLSLARSIVDNAFGILRQFYQRRIRLDADKLCKLHVLSTKSGYQSFRRKHKERKWIWTSGINIPSLGKNRQYRHSPPGKLLQFISWYRPTWSKLCAIMTWSHFAYFWLKKNLCQILLFNDNVYWLCTLTYHWY